MTLAPVPSTDPRRILITGASAGIGTAFAWAYARRGWDLVLTARRKDRLETLADDIAKQTGRLVEVVVADLADPLAPDALVAELDRRELTIDGLVNNAGFSRTTGFITTDPDLHRAMMEVMALAPVRLSRLLVPGMKARGFGRVINVASVAGLLPATGGDTLYGPIKSFLIKASNGLHLEMQGTGVHVTALLPGYTYSEFHDVNGSREEVSSAYPRWMWMTAERVAVVGIDAVEKNRSEVIPGPFNVLLTSIGRLLPNSLLMAQARAHAKRLKRI